MINCAPLIADLVLYCYELQIMTKISKDLSKQHLIQKINNKANTNNDHCPFFYLDIYTIYGKLYIKKKCVKRDDFSFPIVNYTFLNGDVTLSPSYGVYVSPLAHFVYVTPY